MNSHRKLSNTHIYKPFISEEEQKEMAQHPENKPFSDIEDTQKFAREHRAKAWKK